MKFLRIIVIFVFCFGLATEAFAAKKGGKRDIVSVRTKQHAQKQCFLQDHLKGFPLRARSSYHVY